MAEKIIADALDTALARHYEQLGDAEREKQAVVFMDGRWVAIRGNFTPDEIREAVEYIHRYRSSQKLQASMEETSPFVVKNGEVFIKEASIAVGAIQAAAIETPHPVTNIYNISLVVGCSESEKEKTTVSGNGFSIHANFEESLRNSLAAHEEVERLREALKNAAKSAASDGAKQAAGDIAKQMAADKKAMDELEKTIRKAIRNECLDQYIANARASSQTFKQHTIGGEITPLTYTASMSINVNDASSASGADSNIDGTSFEVSDKDMVVNLAGGGRIVISNWVDSSTMVSKALPPLAHTASLAPSCNDIVEETLSAVLTAILPSVPGSRTEEAAIATARAVRSAFNALGSDNASPR